MVALYELALSGSAGLDAPESKSYPVMPYGKEKGLFLAVMVTYHFLLH